MIQVGANISSLSNLYRPVPRPTIERPEFSADESKLAFTICSPCMIAICTIATERSVLLSPEAGASIFDPTFDPRSDSVAFVRSRKLPDGDWDYQIATSRLDGSRLTFLTSSDTQKRSPAYSFDGGKILFEAKGRCLRDRTKYCGADVYEIDLETRKEKRLTDFQALQLAPVSFLPGNSKIVLTAYGSVYSRTKGFAERVNVEKAYGDKNRVFTVALDEPDRLVGLVAGTPTATSPVALPTGEIAFMSRVNEYDGVKAGYVHDVFLYGATGARRHTRLSRYFREFGISNSTRSVVFVAETGDKPAKPELLLWNGNDRKAKVLRCDKPAEQRTLAP